MNPNEIEFVSILSASEAWVSHCVEAHLPSFTWVYPFAASRSVSVAGPLAKVEAIWKPTNRSHSTTALAFVDEKKCGPVAISNISMASPFTGMA